jgi:hypothetical protein
MRLGKRKALTSSKDDCWAETVEKVKAKIRAKVEHPFRVIKQQFGFSKVRYKGLDKNRSQLYMLFAQSNIWQARKTLFTKSSRAKGALPLLLWRKCMPTNTEIAFAAQTVNRPEQSVQQNAGLFRPSLTSIIVHYFLMPVTDLLYQRTQIFNTNNHI